MPGTPLLRGYRRVPGAARRYLTPSGKEISRYEYDTRRAKKAGWKNRGELERFRKSKDGRMWQRKLGNRADFSLYHDAREVERRRRDLPLHKRRVKRGQRFRTLEYRDDADDPELVAAHGPLARLLDAMGVRDVESEWNVGETNAQERR